VVQNLQIDFVILTVSAYRIAFHKGALIVTGYQVCKAHGMTAAWIHPESCNLNQLLNQYWTDAVVTLLSSYDSLDSISIKGVLCSICPFYLHVYLSFCHADPLLSLAVLEPTLC